MNVTSFSVGSIGNSVITFGNFAFFFLLRFNSFLYFVVLNVGSKSSVADGVIVFGVSKFVIFLLYDRKDRYYEKDYKRNYSMGYIFSKSSDKLNLVIKIKTDLVKILGIFLCFRMEDVFLLESFICKKIVYERLIVLIFFEDCIVIVC